MDGAAAPAASRLPAGTQIIYMLNCTIQCVSNEHTFFTPLNVAPQRDFGDLQAGFDFQIYSYLCHTMKT